LCRLCLAGSDRVLPGSFLGLASLTEFLVSALRLASRLAKLLLRLPEFALEVLQLALKPANLTLDSFDPVNRGILRIGHDR
jgi:hypothetical protein